MSNILVRGLPPKIHRKIQILAEEGNQSINQIMIQLVTWAVEKKADGQRAEDKRAEAFRRIREFQNQMYQKYGVQEDSTKIIREERDRRAERLF